jgi:hypothetical protein
MQLLKDENIFLTFDTFPSLFVFLLSFTSAPSVDPQLPYLASSTLFALGSVDRQATILSSSRLFTANQSSGIADSSPWFKHLFLCPSTSLVRSANNRFIKIETSQSAAHSQSNTRNQEAILEITSRRSQLRFMVHTKSCPPMTA